MWNAQSRYPEASDLTYAKAVEVASGMEAAEKTTQHLRGPELACNIWARPRDLSQPSQAAKVSVIVVVVQSMQQPPASLGK